MDYDRHDVASAAILAGGKATRFGGRDKSALIVGGRSIFERQLVELSRVTDDLMIVTAGREGLAEGEGPPAFDGAQARKGGPHSNIRFLHDRVPGCGPLGGLDAALAAARDDVVMAIAADMPFVTTALFEYLLTLAHDADAVVPRTERGYHPLCAVYTRACQAAVARQLEARQLRMIDLLERVRVRTVGPDELDALGDRHRLLTNVNTPAEYDAVAARAGHEL
jgi:molybdopterin-guanine dinucleotide biosynthesis protein A